jgi:hypothetical protein
VLRIVVLLAHVLTYIIAWIEIRNSPDNPRLRISARIVYSEVDFQVSQTRPPNAFRDPHFFGMWVTLRIEPDSEFLAVSLRVKLEMNQVNIQVCWLAWVTTGFRMCGWAWTQLRCA